MRKQIAAANWKMNCTYQQAEELLDQVLAAELTLQPQQEVLFAVPFPYLLMTRSELEDVPQYHVAAQNCHQQKAGAYTGEVSAGMLHSMNIRYCIVGHSERREYNGETDAVLAQKVDRCLENYMIPVFCCGEPLQIREAGTQDTFVEQQLKASLFHLPADSMKQIIIAYEPIWAIGTGKTATTQQAQDMHRHLRSVVAGHYGKELADQISILYGGSVKASNAKEIFACEDVDGGLVGGASLVAEDFVAIIKALK